MDDKILLVVEFIDQHYHNDITDNKIEELTAMSFRDFEEEFKEITGITFFNYKLRRQLTLIKEELFKFKISLSDMDVSPFENQLIYSFYFQREFAISVKAAVKHNYLSLQPKYGSSEWEKYDKIILNLLKIYKPDEALKFLLSQPPCYLDASEFLEFHTEGVPGLGFERSYPKFFTPKIEAGDSIKKLKTIYMLEEDLLIEDSKNRSIRYAIVDRILIYKLMLEYEAKVEYMPSDLTTVWSCLDAKCVQLNKEIPEVTDSIIQALLKQDSEKISFESLEELCQYIWVNYSKPKNTWEEGEPGFPADFYYENLEMVDLIEEINMLLLQGLVFFKQVE